MLLHLFNWSSKSSFCSIYFLFLLQHLLISPSFLAKKKAISFNIFSIFWFCWISHFYNIYPIIKVILALSSISSGLLSWSANHASMDENYAFVVFNIVNEWGAIEISWINCLFGTKKIKLYMVVDNCYCLNYNVLKQLQEILILAYHLHLSLTNILPNNIIFSGDNNSNLWPVFIF